MEVVPHGIDVDGTALPVVVAVRLDFMVVAIVDVILPRAGGVKVQFCAGFLRSHDKDRRTHNVR